MFRERYEQFNYNRYIRICKKNYKENSKISVENIGNSIKDWKKIGLTLEWVMLSYYRRLVYRRPIPFLRRHPSLRVSFLYVLEVIDIMIDKIKRMRQDSRDIEAYRRRQAERMKADGGEGSGNFGHAGRKGKVGGSAKSGSGSHEGYRGLKEKSKNFYKGKRNGTYDAKSGEEISFTDGYQVSFVRPEAENLSDEQWAILSEYMERKTGGKPNIGVYNGDSELSFHANDAVQAIELMYLFNQESVLIWGLKDKYEGNDWQKMYIWNPKQEEKTDYDEIFRKIQADNE